MTKAIIINNKIIKVIIINNKITKAIIINKKNKVRLINNKIEKKYRNSKLEIIDQNLKEKNNKKKELNKIKVYLKYHLNNMIRLKVLLIKKL